MPNPFGAGFVPSERKNDPSETLKLADPGDYFGIKVTDIGATYESKNTNSNGDEVVSESFIVTGEVLPESNLQDWKHLVTRVKYPARKPGETGKYFHALTYPGKDGVAGKQSWKDQNFQEALKAAGVNSLEKGDELWVQFTRIDGKSHVYDYVVRPTKRDKPAFPGK